MVSEEGRIVFHPPFEIESTCETGRLGVFPDTNGLTH